MCDDETLVNSFRRALELGAMPTVHAENGDWSTCCSRRWRAWASPDGRHPLSRPPMVEAEAANRRLRLPMCWAYPSMWCM
ncbi:hypothetical protein [Comamonas sp. JC664]|uniref:hypothetical protein n=1 Tax=Comamonas sp. JC664 TaxID=2801917 RepID=UPI0036734CA2